MSDVSPTPQQDKGILYKGKYYKNLDEINAAIQAETGAKITWNQPGQGPTPGTRYPTPGGETKPVLALSTPKNDASIEQQRLDYRATLDAYQRWAQQDAQAEEVRPNVWIAGKAPVVNIDRVGMWSKAAGTGTGSMSWQLEFTDIPTNQLIGRMAADTTGLIRYPFTWLRENAGKPLFNGARWVGDRLAPEWSEDALGYAVGKAEIVGSWFYDQAFKPLIRDVSSTMMLPIELLENIVMTGIFQPILENNIDDFNTPNALEKSQASWKERITGIFTNSTFAQYGLERWRNRNFEGGQGEFAYTPGGEGFFPAGESLVKKNQLEEYLRPTLYGQTATVGRVAASPLVEWGVVQAGDDVHSLISGFTDAGFQLYGDPATWFSLADYFKGLGVIAELPTAPATQRQLAKLAKKGITIDPELWQDATKARQLINQVEGLTDDAIELLQPKAGIVYSGDDVNPNITKTSFLDIDDPNHPRNHDNLLGAGLYVTDAPYVATSYTPNAEIFNIPPQVAEQLPGVTSVPLASETAGAGRVYKFEMSPDMKIIDGELPFEEAFRGITDQAGQPVTFETLLDDYGVGQNFANKFIDGLRQAGFPVPDKMAERIIESVSDEYAMVERYRTTNVINTMQKFDDPTNIPQSIFYESKDDWGTTFSIANEFTDQLFFADTPQSRLLQQSFIASAEKALTDKLVQYRKILTPEKFRSEVKGAIISYLDNLLGDRRSPKLFAVKDGDKFVVLDDVNQAKYGIKFTDYNFRPTDIPESYAEFAPNVFFSDEASVARRAKAYDRFASLYGIKADERWDRLANFRRLDGSEIEIYTPSFHNWKNEFAWPNPEVPNPITTKIWPTIPDNPDQIDVGLYAKILAEGYGTYDPKQLRRSHILLNKTKVFDISEKIGDIGNFKGVKFVINDEGNLIFDFEEMKNLGPRPDRKVFNDWLASKGIDAVRYDGGTRIGGYGRHTAHVVLRPSKMTILDSLTGKKIPTNQAAELFEESGRLKDLAADLAKARGFQSIAGLVESGSHVSAAPTQWEVYKNSGSWKNLSLIIAAEKNPYKIWSTVLKRRSPELAILLSKAGSPEEVTRLMDVAVYNPDPLNYMRQLPGWSGNMISEAGFRLKQAASRQTNMFASLPRTPFLPIDDLDEGARHVDDLLQLFSVPVYQRDTIMNSFLQTASQADPQIRKQQLFAFARNFEETVIKERLAPMVKKMAGTRAGEDLQNFVDTASRWRRNDLDQTRVWVGDDMMNAVPLPYLDGDGMGPALIADLFNSNIYLADPEDVDKLVKLFKPWAEMTYALRRFPGIYEAGKMKDFMRQKFLNAQGLWKANVLFGLKYTTRVVADEAMRTTMSGQFRGPFSYISEIATGRLNIDILGRMIPKAGEANQIAADLVTVRRIAEELQEAVLAGDDLRAGRLQKALAKFDTEDNLLARQAELEAILNDEGVNVVDAMIGRKPGLAYETVTRDGTPTYVRSRLQHIVDRTKQNAQWQRAIADEIVGLSTEPDVRQVARMILNGGVPDPNDPFFRMTSDWLYKGKGRTYFEKYYKGVDKVSGYQWDNLGEAQNRVKLLHDMIMRVTGGNTRAIKAIRDQKVKLLDEATGTMQEFTVGSRTSEGPRATRELRKYLRTANDKTGEIGLFDDPRAPQKAAYWPAVPVEEEKKLRDLYGKFMQYTYGVTSDKVARVPLFQSTKWNKIADMIPMMSKSEAQRLAKVVIDSDLPDGLKARIAANLDTAGAGELTLETVQQFADKWTLEDNVNLLFDASKKSNFGRQHAFLFPFFDAYRETAATMLKLGLNPQNIHKVDMARRGLESFRVGGPGETMLFGERDVNADGKQEGFLYTDPNTGKQVFATPLFGALASMWSDVPFNMAIPLEGLTMQANVIPGVGPVVAVAYDAVGPKSEDWAWLNKVIFPYGEPGDKTIQDYFAPMWVSRIAQGRLADTQFGEAFRGLMGDPRQNEVFKYMHLRAMQTFAATRTYEPGEAGIAQHVKESYEAALALWTMRGVAQLFLPTAPITQYYAETNKGLMPLGSILDDIRKTEREITAKGGSIADAQEVSLKKWGDLIVPYLASLSKSTRAGSEPSNDFESFRNNNQYLFEKYPASAGLFFERSGNYAFEAYDLQRRLNEREYLLPDEFAKSLDGLMGGILYRRYENNIPAELRNTPLGRAILTQKAAEIRRSNPFWNPSLYAAEREAEIARQVNEVIAAAQDQRLNDQPSIGSLRDYLAYRDGVIGAIRSKNPKLSPDGWKSANGGALEREVLFLHGEKLATQNPAFRNLWDNLLSREFERLTPEVVDSLTRTIQPPKEVTAGG